MKKYLLPEGGNFYKANLHCHTTVSDGRLTPEQVKQLYVKNGYSVIAYTDHDILLSHSDLDDDNFLALHGYEMEIDENVDVPFQRKKTCHMCFIALDPDNMTQVCYHREKYLFGGAPKLRHKIKFDESLPDYERAYTPERINDMIRIGRENGFFVTYNHPYWSLETLNEYGKLRNLNAMEIVNNSCLVGGYADYNEKIYDEMLVAGACKYCISTDDNHNVFPEGDPRNDSCGGFTVIKAPCLDYKQITSALVNGNFYASQGPEIHDLWIEDDCVHITCSNATSIKMNTGIRVSEIEYAKDGELTKASFKLRDDFIYFRLTVTDERGKHANTNAYFIDEVLK